MPATKTVRVKNEHFEDGVLINADDFDPELHELVGDDPEADGKGKPKRR